MSYEKIRICLEQKNIFMESIINYSKQLEVRAGEEDVDFGDLLEKRRECMDRIDKCNQLIASEVDLLEDAQVKEQLRAALRVIPTHEDDASYPQDILPMYQLNRKYISLLQRAVELDNAAGTLAKKQYEETKKLLAKLRSKAPASKDTSIFH